MPEEVGVGYIRLLPSGRGFGRAVTKQLRKELTGVGTKAGEDLGDEIADEAGDRAAEAGRKAGQKFSEGFKPKVDAKSLADQLRGLAADANAELRAAKIDVEIDPGRLAALAEQVKASIEKSNPQVTVGARTSDVLAQVREQLTKDVGSLKGLGKEAGQGVADGVGDGVESRRSRILGAGRSVGSWFSTSVSEQGGDAGRRLLRGFASELSVTGKPIAVTLGTAFSAQFIGAVVTGLASGTAKVAHGLGSIAALLPAVAVAGVTAFATIKIAVLGVADALEAGLTGDIEAFDEALAGLAPSAQAFVREIVGMKSGLDTLKGTVQENFFAPLVDTFRPLGEIYLPLASQQLGGLAGTFGTVAASLVGWLTIPRVVESISTALGFVIASLDDVARAAAFLPIIFLPLLSVGSTFLPALTGGLDTAAARLAQFMSQAERTGQLRDFIQGGLDKLRELWGTAQQLWRIFSDIGAVVGTVFGGLGAQAGGFLDTIERAAEGLRRFTESAQGSSMLGQIFETASAVANTLLGTLERVVGMIGDIFGPILPDILDFVEALADLKSAVLDTGLDALEPILGGIASILGSVLLPALTGLANWLADNRPVLQGIGIAILTLLVPSFIAWAVSAGLAAIATLAAMLPIILLGIAIAALAALVIIHFDTIKGAIMAAFNWVKDNWQTLLVILTGPIGLAVALIVTHWDTIKNAAMTAFNWVKDNWQAILGILTLPITTAVDVITSTFDSVVSFVTELPGRIADAASGMWDGITGAFKSAINGIIGLWNGLSFPSVTVGGGDPLGPFGPSVPRVTIGGWDLPNIPTLHQGGVFRAPAGADEGLALLKDREGVLTPSQMAATGSTLVGGAAPQPVVLQVQSGDHWFAEWVRHMVAAQAGGNVQVMFGRP